MNEGASKTDYAVCANRAYRFLTVAVVTKFAVFLTGIEQFLVCHRMTAETAKLEDVKGEGILDFLAMADTFTSFLAVLFLCLWLSRAVAAGVVTLRKEGLPRQMGWWCAVGIAASVLTTVVSFASLFLRAGVLRPLFEGAEAVPLRIPAELPVRFFEIESLSAVAMAVLQVLVFLFFRSLILRSSAAPAEGGRPSVPEVRDQPPEPVPEKVPEPDAGFGWPDQPER